MTTARQINRIHYSRTVRFETSDPLRHLSACPRPHFVQRTVRDLLFAFWAIAVLAFWLAILAGFVLG
jgi:hypothetical protein